MTYSKARVHACREICRDPANRAACLFVWRCEGREGGVPAANAQLRERGARWSVALAGRLLGCPNMSPTNFWPPLMLGRPTHFSTKKESPEMTDSYTNEAIVTVGTPTMPKRGCESYACLPPTAASKQRQCHQTKKTCEKQVFAVGRLITAWDRVVRQRQLGCGGAAKRRVRPKPSKDLGYLRLRLDQGQQQLQS
jgi:hypothetical protein